MVEYGYMEGKYLRSRFIEPYTEIRVNEKGEKYNYEVTIKEQIANLSDNWKPVDKIDSEQLKSEEGYFVTIEPYDAGDRISYRYIKKEDQQALKTEISALKKELSDSDYQIIKCYEASLLNEEMPYPYKTLIKERQSTREKINLLQDRLALIKS